MPIVWIVLPNGVVTQTLRASVFVSPRLSGPTLAGTPFADWPATLAASRFRVNFEPGGPSFFVTPTPQYDSALWLQVFGSAAVSPFTFKDNATRAVWSYPVSRAKAFIESVYAAVQATSATDYPAVDPATPNALTGAIAETNVANAQRVSRGRDLYAQVRLMPSAAQWTAAALSEQAMLGGLGPDARAMYLAKRFFDRPASATSKDAKGNLLARPRPMVPTFDFHQKLALLADHPFLLRKLGLVLDLDLPITPIDAPPTGFLTFGVFDVQGNATPDCVYPRTAYQSADPDVFRAASPTGNTEVREGFVPLDDTTAYFASQGEVDGDVHKLVGFASNVALLTAKLTAEAGAATAPPPQSVPARRSSGLFVARNGRDTAAKSRFTANAAIDAAIKSMVPPDLWAPDLLRGYRVDVKTRSSPWYSLHRRRVAYSYGLSMPTPIGAEVADEGYLKAASGTSDSAPDGPPDLYLHEIIFGWEGWSLSAPRPGRRLMPTYATPADSIAPPDDAPSADFPLHAPVRAEPGSLPTLRFGYPYQFRMRAVDLAGNSLPPSAPDAALPHTTALQTYKRYEPIPPPTVVPRWAFTEGESAEHLVIRSGDGLGASAYAADLNGKWADPAFPLKVYRGTSERHLAPPKTTQAFAEAHGDFDGAFLASGDKRAFFRLGTREEGTFSDKRIPSLTVDDSYLGGNPNLAAIVTPPQVPLDQRRPADGGAGVSSLTENRGDPLAPGEYVVCGADDATLPYLPDSAAGGFVLYDPAAGAALTAASWLGAWPDYQPVRLRLAEGSMVGAGPVVGRVVTVTLPPATIVPLEYSSAPAPGRVDHFAYALDYGVPAAELATGRHWMMTPRRQLVLVHAVPKPLSAPQLTITASRGIDQTWVTHFGTLMSHSRSTNHVDLEASWDEVLDEPSKPLPADGVSSPAIPQTGHAYQVPVAYSQDATPVLRLRHDFHDTRHRVVKYRPVAHTRYKEYFPAALTAVPANITLEGTAPGPRVDGTFSIPSSSRPVVPKVLYVVPTFRWESSAGLSVRRGGGLRVYLERPWYTTGEGELLAIVLAASTGGAPAERLSRWGRDPLFADGVATALKASSFVSPAASASDLALGDGSGMVDVVAYPVEFNAERRLWFCDVQLEPGTAYFPFVSLSLARYQPESVRGVELSTPVRADFGQLTADRSLTFRFDGASARLELTGVVSPNAAESIMPDIPIPAADANSGRRTVPTTHRVVAYVQERTPGAVGEMGWNAAGAELTFAGSRGPSDPVARWVVDVPIPAAPAPARERRLVIEEREYFQADPVRMLSIRGSFARDYRVVYLDTVPIP